MSAKCCRRIDFLLLHLYFSFWFEALKKNAWQYLYFKILLYISQNADKMTWFWHWDVVELIFYQYIYISIFNFWHLKKNCMRISLFWNITIYRPKYRHVGKMTLNCFFIVTFVFQFLICCFLKNACQYLYFKMLLYISQNADMSGKWRNYGNMMSVFLFVIFTLLFKKKTHANIFILKFHYI